LKKSIKSYLFKPFFLGSKEEFRSPQLCKGRDGGGEQIIFVGKVVNYNFNVIFDLNRRFDTYKSIYNLLYVRRCAEIV